MSNCRAIVFSKYGNPESVLKVVEFLSKDLNDGKIKVKILSAPINPSDINQIEGVYPQKPQFRDVKDTGNIAIGGNEGLVEVVDAPLKSGFDKGDWAIFKTPAMGTWRTFANIDASSLIKIPKNCLTKSQASTLSVNPPTAVELLKHVNLEKGDWFIQNGANSSVGKSVIQIARIYGYKSINIIRDRPNTSQIKEELQSLGADLVITSNELEDFQTITQTISEAIGDKKIKLGINCVGGKAVLSMAKVISNGATIVTYGAMSKLPVSIPAGILIFKQISFTGYWISESKRNDPQQFTSIITQLLEWIKEGQYRIPDPEVIRFGENITETKSALTKIFSNKESFSQKKVFIMD